MAFKFAKFIGSRWIKKYREKYQRASSAKAHRLGKLPIRVLFIFAMFLPLADELIKAISRNIIYEMNGGFQIFERKSETSFWVKGINANWILFNKNNISGVIADNFFDYEKKYSNSVFRLSLRDGAQACGDLTYIYYDKLDEELKRYLSAQNKCLQVEETTDTDFYLMEVSEWSNAAEAKFLPFELKEKSWVLRDFLSGRTVAQYRQLGTLTGSMLSLTPAARSFVTTPLDVNGEFFNKFPEQASLMNRIFSTIIDEVRHNE